MDPLPIFFEYELRRIKAAADPRHEYRGPPGTADHRLRTAVLKYTNSRKPRHEIMI